KELHMFVWSSSASPVSEGNMKHAVNKAAAEFGSIDPYRAIPTPENFSPMTKTYGDQKEIDIDDPKSQINASPFKKLGTEEGENKNHRMPPASVMTRLILIMVWRKLIRNPNTYSSLLGLIWSLVSFRFDFD
ncbi:auxin efflux carrier component 2, partial [Tanacetum coccineum]